jgi:diaminohydroxyphosphoribosylaminopyrimidine deaminase / 5-amino-6-(5-phosphoribosylamino)uracil reductase
MKLPALPLATSTLVPADVQALWPHCLALAQARREGRAPTALPGVLRQGSQGWELCEAWDDEARTLFALLKPLLDVQPGARPWVIGQLGQSLDGFIATRTGDARFVNGAENLTHLHRLRALSDAVLVGAGTVALDDPQLTTRHVSGPHPVRVLFDPGLQLERFVERAQVFRNGPAATLWLCDARHREAAQACARAARVLAVPGLLGDDGAPRVRLALQALHAQGLHLLFVEGGGVTVSRFFAQGCLDRLHLAIAPVLIGNGRAGLRFEGQERLRDCARPPVRVVPMGQDQLWDLDLAAPEDPRAPR